MRASSGHWLRTGGDQRCLGFARRRVDGQTGLFVDDREMIVLVDDVELDIRRSLDGDRLSRVGGDEFAEAQLVRRSLECAVDTNQAVVDQASSLAARCAIEATGKELVETLTVLVGH